MILPGEVRKIVKNRFGRTNELCTVLSVHEETATEFKASDVKSALHAERIPYLKIFYIDGEGIIQHGMHFLPDSTPKWLAFSDIVLSEPL